MVSRWKIWVAVDDAENEEAGEGAAALPVAWSVLGNQRKAS
jgi:hypothetical protein